MGFKHVEAALQAQLPHQTGIDMGTLKLVLIAICQHADNNTDYCFPSTRRLARMTHLGKSTCARAVAYLHSMGCFTNYAKGKGHGSSSFILDLKRIQSWRIDWDSVRQMDAKDEMFVPQGDSGILEDSVSVPLRDVASTSGTQSPVASMQSPATDLNLSFDRSGVLSLNAVTAAQSENLQKTESVKTDCLAGSSAKPAKRRLTTFADYDDDGNYRPLANVAEL
jgi:hypothetical protein